MSAHDGHRQRLRDKLETGALVEHELLELALFYAIPRKNTNDIAHRLLSTFGSVADIFSASLDELKTVDGIGDSAATYLRCVGKLIDLCQKDEAESFYPRKVNRENFMSYVKTAYAYYEKEVLDVYFMDEDCFMKKRDRFSCGESASVRIDPKEFTQYLISGKYAGVILVHNHPFGNAKPSQKDDDMTAQCQVLCSAHNVMLCDHIIYSPSGLYSYFLDGKMCEYSDRYSIKKVMKNFLGKGRMNERKE